MASETGPKDMNGNYAAQQPFEQQIQTQPANSITGSTSSGVFGADRPSTNTGGNTTASNANEGNSSVPKDEVGWYFVEQYYTTLSKNPEKLHLFYSKRSQFVSGVEAEKVSVSVGQRAINERIKSLDISDCKVRVSNVDSQESFKNIVVQVIGEMSNKAAPHRKFVQTFVLAEQPNGYFVLNDIFRYILEDEEEEQLEPEVAPIHEPPPTAAPEAGPDTLTSSGDPERQQRDIEQVDKKLEEEIKDTSGDAADQPTEIPVAAEPATDATEASDADHGPAADIKEQAAEEPEEHVGEASKIEDVPQEKPKDPDPTPVASPPKPLKATPAQTQPAALPKPAAPKTWANLVAANRIAPPAVPSSASSTSPAPAPARVTQPPANRSSSPPPPSASEDVPNKSHVNGNAGWQMAGQDSSKRQNRQQSISGSIDKDHVLGYVKNVTDKVDASLLKAALTEHGKLVYFDVSRQKNCAFVEFSDAAGYQSAVAANPYNIGGEQIWVEERRPRPNAYGGGYNNRGGMRGGRGGSEGRGGSQGRGGFPKDGGRGGYAPRGRGGSMTPRGRGQPQAA